MDAVGISVFFREKREHPFKNRPIHERRRGMIHVDFSRIQGFSPLYQELGLPNFLAHPSNPE
jgi:hypothetical protein